MKKLILNSAKALSLACLFSFAVSAKAADENPGAVASAERVQAAYAAHDKLDEYLGSEKAVAAWAKVREELSKEGEASAKKREILGRVFIIADTDKGNILRLYFDTLAAKYGTNLDLKKEVLIVANAWSLAKYHEASKAKGLALSLVQSAFLETAFGKGKGEDFKKLSSIFVSYFLGEAELKLLEQTK